MYGFVHGRTLTYTCSLLYTLQDVLGRNQEVDQASEGVTLVTTLNDLKELAENCGGGGLKGRVKGRQKVLDGLIQRVWVLKAQRNNKQSFTSLIRDKHSAFYVWVGVVVGLGRRALLVI